MNIITELEKIGIDLTIDKDTFVFTYKGKDVLIKKTRLEQMLFGMLTTKIKEFSEYQ